MLARLCNIGLRGGETAQRWMSEDVRGEGGQDNVKGTTGACARSQVFRLVCAWGAHRVRRDSNAVVVGT